MAALALCFAACDKLKNESPLKHTWTGTLYKDCTGQPVAGATLQFESATYLPGYENTNIVATAVTDAQGHFVLEYSHVANAAQTCGMYVNRSTGADGNFLMNAPLNQDIERDLVLSDCFQVYVEVDNQSQVDSLYVSMGKVTNAGPYKLIRCDEYYDGCAERVQPYAVFGQDFSVLLQSPATVRFNWDHAPVRAYAGADTSFERIRAALISNLDDTITDFGLYEIESRGYPMIDTLRLSF